MPPPPVGNSLSSISSTTTLPPSPRPSPQSDHGVSNKVSASRPPQALNQRESRNDRPSGSVPSPRPKLVKFASSAPPTRPRFRHSLSAVQVSSPLNPASQRPLQLASFTGTHLPHCGSIPHPGSSPTRLFCSSLNTLSIPRHQPDPRGVGFASEPVETTAPDVQRIGSTDEAFLKREDADIHHSKPIRITPPHSREPSRHTDEDGYQGAPSSYSTFIETMVLPK